MKCVLLNIFSLILKENQECFRRLLFFGNIVHGVLEDNVSSTDFLNIEKMKLSFFDYKNTLDPKSEIPLELHEVGLQILEDFYDTYSDRTFNVYDKEMGFNFVLGNYLVIGYIDRVDLLNNTVEIIDYKTGKREVAQKDIHNNLQLGIYALAASLAFPGKQIKASLHYLRSGRIKSHEYTQEDLEKVKQMVIDKINLIVNDFNFTATKNERVCYFCDHAKSGACATGAARLKRSNKG
jgi:CRISPR/Cas system-associated exonuclease Cas4 (RecB family)